MNPTLRFLQKQGLKVSLPLLLLATACGDGSTTSAFQPNSAGAAGRAISAASQPNTNGMLTPSGSGAGLTANVTLPDNADQTSTKAVPTPSPTTNGGTSGGGGSSDGVTPGAGVGAGAAASVPEPAALAGLAIAAAGMIVLKRKQAA